jgi:beta-aspartyl-peptidase (threonine type)
MDLGQVPRWAIILHGGAKDIPKHQEQAHRKGCERALAAGVAVLRNGGSAVQATEASVRVLEEEPVFNAGTGSVRNAVGDIEMDAAMMEGRTLRIGAVSAIRRVRHPVSVARMLLHEQPILLTSGGAERFAAENAAELCSAEDLMADEEKPGRDTVGCVALDLEGDMAVAASTGGLEGSPAGRVGDTALPGCGFYADNSIGAVAFSGDGESIARTLLAAHVMTMLHDRDPQTAAESAIARLTRVGGEAGCIVVDRRGRFGCAHNSSDFAFAFQASDLDRPHVFLRAARKRARA